MVLIENRQIIQMLLRNTGFHDDAASLTFLVKQEKWFKMWKDAV
jgi:hypothetical protein